MFLLIDLKKIEINFYSLGKFYIEKKYFINRITVVIHIIDAETLLTVIKVDKKIKQIF